MIRWLDISGGFLRSINIQYSCISILWLQCSLLLHQTCYVKINTTFGLSFKLYILH